MPFQIVRNDITKMQVDAIVNTANPLPKIGDGTDYAVYKAAGMEQMFAERKQIGQIQRGQTAFTKGYNLPAKYVIHAVGTGWFGGTMNEFEILANCYKNSLKLAVELNCNSIAFPLLSSGNYGFPKDKALKIAVDEISNFLLENEMEVYLVVYDLESFEVSSKLFSGIQAFIDENYIADNIDSEYFAYPPALKNTIRDSKERAQIRRLKSEPLERTATTGSVIALFQDAYEEALPEKITPIESLEDFLKTKTENFQNKLQSYIASKNLSNAEVYHKANIDKKLFSKIICNKDYVPKKRNVLALAIGLELELSECEKLLSSAGYAFSNGDKSDLIVKYFVIKKMFNIYEINAMLFKYGYPVLGNSTE